MLLGVGAGQMNRVASARIAVESAKSKIAEFQIQPHELACASDAFFPFLDGIDVLSLLREQNGKHSESVKLIFQM